MTNFIEPKVLQECDVTTVNVKDAHNQLSDELGIGTSIRRLLLCDELEDNIIETRNGSHF
jgi:hypothetical protein